jgi:N-acetylmuramoyl-L-alanine amidase
LSSGACGHYSPWRWGCLYGALSLCAFVLALSPPANAGDPNEPEIVSREAWGAVPANTDLMQEQKPGEIIIHHTGEHQQPKVSLDAKMRGLQSFSMRPGKVGTLSKPAWGDILYHFYIDVAGKIAEGRDIDFAGDSTTNFDGDGSIQITVEGDFEREEPTQEQLASLMKLVTWIAVKYGIPAEAISGHSDHDQTDCPGKNLKPFLEDLRKAVEDANSEK